MSALKIYEAEDGSYVVRPDAWAGVFDKYGRIKVGSANHTAVFSDKTDAEDFVRWKTLQKEAKLLELVCAPGDLFWELNCGAVYRRVAKTINHCVFVTQNLGKVAFLSKEEAFEKLRKNNQEKSDVRFRLV